MLLTEQRMRDLYYRRVAAHPDGEPYAKEIGRLERQLESAVPRVPVTPAQAAQNRKDLASSMGLKPRKV
jgi:hypothetical protein